MNQQLAYLKRLYSGGGISQQDYVNRLNVAYRINPTGFSEEDIDLIEKETKNIGAEFNRDMAASESNIGTVLNQFASGVVEGFTTLGWATEAETTTESMANKLGHFIGFAPDIIASVLSMGAAVPGALARRGTAKLAVKQAVGRPTKAVAQARQQLREQVGRQQAREAKIKGIASKLNLNMGKAAAKISFGDVTPFAKSLDDVIGTKGWQIRSIPMRIADKIIDSSTKKIGDAGLLTEGFFAKALFQHPRFQKIAKESAHLGVALGASAVWQGPKAIAESTLHGALAGAVFGSVGEFVNISKLIGNPKTEQLGKDAIRRLTQNYQKEEFLNAFARGTVGSAFQGGMSTIQGAPLPDQIYEYMMGFFFGANTKSINELKFRKIINENPMLDGTKNIERYKKQIEKVEEYQNAPQEVKDMFERHTEVLFQQQLERSQRILVENAIDREINTILEEKGIDKEKLTVEQLKEAAKEAVELDHIKEIPDVSLETFKAKIETDKTFLKEVARRKRAQEKHMKDVKERLFEETGIDIDAIETMNSNDMPNPVSINQALEQIHKLMIEDPNFEGYSKKDLKIKLLNSLKDNQTYEQFVDNIKIGIENFNEKISKTEGNPLRTFFVRAKAYSEQYHYSISADGTIKYVGNGELKVSEDGKKLIQTVDKPLRVDKDGKPLVSKEAENEINIRYGDATRLVFTFAENPRKKGTYEEPLTIKSVQKIIKELTPNLLKKGYYIYGSPKDKGTIIAHKIPGAIDINTAGGKRNLDLVIKLLKSKYIAVPDKFLKTDNDKLFSAANLMYKLLDNGYIEYTDRIEPLEFIKALKEFKEDVIDGKINVELLKEVKYETLYQGKGISIPTSAVNTLLDNQGFIGGEPTGFFNMIAIKDKVLERYGKEYEQGTDGGLIIRDDVYDAVLKYYGLSEKSGFMKPVIRASARNNKGEIRGKVGGFKPESDGLNKFMLDNNIHMMIYGTGLKSKGKLSINELIDGPNDTWSLKNDIDIAKIRPEEITINPDIADYVYKNIVEIQKKGMLKLYKQVLDKNTSQDFSNSYFEALSMLKQISIDANKQKTQEFIDGGESFTNFKLDEISLQSIIDALIDNPTSLKSKKIIRDILESTKQDEFELSDSLEIDAEDLAQLGLTPEILKRTNHGFNSLLEYQNFISNKLARYIINRTNQFKVKHGFKAYSGLYTSKMEKDFNLKDNEFMLGEEFRKMPIEIDGIDKPITLEDAFQTFQKLNYKSNRKEYLAYKNALTFLIMRTPNSGNGGVRALVFKGFKKRGGFNFFANELNSEYLGGKDNDGDTVTGYQSLPNVMKAEFAKDKVFYELNDGDVKNPTKDLKGMKDPYTPGKTIAETMFGIEFADKQTPTELITQVISGMQSGADIAGLYAAEALGIPTGGNGTKGHISEAGKTPKERMELAERFNIQEGESTSLPERTMKNVDDAGATIAFRTQPSTGTDKTIGYAQTGRWQRGNSKEGIYNDGYRPVLVLNTTNSTAKNIKLIKDFITQNPGVINIAGSRESSVSGSQKQIQKVLEIAFKELKQVKKTTAEKTFGEKLGEMLSTEMRLKAGKAALEGKKATGVIVNATTNFQILFDFVKNNGGVLDIGGGYKLKIRLDDFNHLKDVSYVGINTAVDSSEYIKIDKATDNVQKIFERFFTLETGGKDVTKKNKWYKLLKNRDTILNSFSLFSKAVTNKKGVSFDLAGDNSLFAMANRFVEDWGKFNTRDENYTNYFLETAKKISDLEMQSEIFSFDFAKPENIVIAIEKMHKNLISRSTFKDLGIADLYRDLDINFLLKDLKAGKNLRGKVANIIGLDLLTTQGDILIDLMSRAGYNKDSIIADLEIMLQETFKLKQNKLDKRETTEGILQLKRQLKSIIESKFGKGKQLSKNFEEQLFRFVDFALLAHPIVKQAKDFEIGYVNGKKITFNQGVKLIKELHKELDVMFPNGTDIEYNSSSQKIFRKIRKIESLIEAKQEKLTFDSPGIDAINTQIFFTKIDEVYSRSREIKADKPEQLEIKFGENKKETVKVEELNETIRDEINKENNEKEVELTRYEEIINIDFDKLLKDKRITEYGKVQLVRLQNFMNNYKGIGRSIEVLYEQFTTGAPFGTFMVGKEFTDATAKDIQRFVDYLEGLTTPGLIKTYLSRKFIGEDENGVRKIIGAPNWAAHFITNTLNNELKFIESIEKDSTWQQVTNVVLSKDGQLKIKKGLAPISTLEYNTTLALAFHRLGNAKDADMKEQIENTIRLVKPEDSKQAKDFNLLFKYVMYSREYNNGAYYSGIKNKAQRDNIKEKYNKYKKEYDRMIKEGLKFTFAKEGVEKGERENKGVEEISVMINEAYTNILTQVKNDIIQSRWEVIQDRFKKYNKSIDDYKVPSNEKVERPTNPKEAGYIDKLITYEIQQLERLFLDKNGLLSDTSKIDALYADLSDLAIRSPLSAIRQLPSITDVNFVRYYQRLNEHLEVKFPEINFNKVLTPEQYKKVKSEINEFKKILQPNKRIGIGRYENESGLVSRFVPHTGAFDTAQRREINGAAIDKLIESKIARASNNDKLLARIDTVYAISERTAQDKIAALARYKKYLNDKYNGYRTKNVNIESDIQELAVIEDFTLTKGADTYRSNGNLKSRGTDISLPEWDTSINHIERYVGAQYRNMLNSNLSLKTSHNIKRFVRKNPFGTDKNITESWAYFMMDVAKNQMGLDSLRNFDMHGITKQELNLLKSYMDNKLKKEGLRLSYKDKDFLARVEAQYGLDVFQRAAVQQVRNNLKKAGESAQVIQDTGDTMIYNYRLDNIKKLAQDKNINKIGRLKSGYQLMTDESVVNFTERLDRLFGGRILKDAPENRIDRDRYIAKLGQGINALEGNFEMMSLLFHPKTFITNIYGGFTNTITDVGLSSFTNALKDEWMVDNVWGENTTYTITDSATGKQIKKKITNRKEWEEWQSFLGIFEDMLINEATKDIRFQKKGFVIPFEQAAKRVNRLIGEKGLRTNKNLKELDDFAELTFYEAAKESGVFEAAKQSGAFFMRSSEFLLRSRTWDAAYLNAKKILGDFGKQLPFDSPVLIEIANRTVEASQFIYHATQRPNFSNTSLGRIMTRFHPYAWNSIGRRIKTYRGAKYEEWSGGYNTKRAQRQITADLMALALANIFVASIFDYALSPPMNWMQDSAALLFGDKEDRERAFFSQYPHPVLAPLSIVTPPAARFILTPVTAILNNDYDNLKNYTVYTYMPFGRFARDAMKTYDTPAMFGEFMFGLPVHTLQRIRRKQLDELEVQDEEEIGEVEE